MSVCPRKNTAHHWLECCNRAGQVNATASNKFVVIHNAQLKLHWAAWNGARHNLLNMSHLALGMLKAIFRCKRLQLIRLLYAVDRV